ncbi:MAG: hypothetical protein JW751_04445 [Polyangiaceae bacterium]|nr:hypothetical protein [Polyangiaceae bacterium]
MKAPASDPPEPEASPHADASPAKRDVVLVHGITSDGTGLEVLRARNEGIEQGALRPLEHGRPIHGDVVRLRRRPEHPLVFDVDSVLTPSAPTVEPTNRTTKGPAQVASDLYRSNWDHIWLQQSDPDPAN